MLKKRVLTSLCTVPVVIAVVWFEGWFPVLAAVCAVLAVWEFYHITGVARFKPLAVFGVIWTLAVLLKPHYLWVGFLGELTLFPLLVSAVIFSLMILVFQSKREGSVSAWAWMLAGILYLGLLLSHLIGLSFEASPAWLYLAIFATFASDTAAYFIGRALGKHKLAPRISPGKTWEGAAGGLLGAVVIALLFTLETPLQLPIGYGEAVLLGLLISVFGQLGDLAESLLKRNAHVKESGGLMPGHGGLLDRLDSILFAGVAVYWYYIYFIQ